MQKIYPSGLVWFRRDLRIQDNAALSIALQHCAAVHCAFVFDREILDSLPRADRRVEFIRESLVELDANLRKLAPDAGLIVLHGVASECVPALAMELGIGAVFAANDYEPQAIGRDQRVREALLPARIELLLIKDHVIWEQREVLTQLGKPYGVFTPYLRAWMAKLEAQPLVNYEIDTLAARTQLVARPERHARSVPGLAELGFLASNLTQLALPTGESGAARLVDDFTHRIGHYDATRNFPAVKGPSYLSVHLRFGTVSIRQLVGLAQKVMSNGKRDSSDLPETKSGAATWLGELVWRDFYFQILSNFPHVATGAFKPEYDAIAWEDGPVAHTLFTAWCEGRTGYPLVDAAMLQLNQTGYMHNRLRMVAGSFLVKHLGLDWRWGERYFATHLNDFDLSANNGGWQWVSSSGCDAQPYFRIFNPVTQSEKFDADGKFIKRYLPALGGLGPKAIHAPWLAKPMELISAGVTLGENYPVPVVDHASAREKTLARYAVVKKAVSG
jgi:deoxyribodipyrimidine photo-lyase